MQTSALITLINKEVPDWSRVLILSLLDEIQKMVFSQNATEQMRIYDSSTGNDPLLTVTNTVFEYDINTTNGFPNNAWRVYEVYETTIDTPFDDVTCFDAAGSEQYARIVFNKPVSGQFYIRCYRFPISLSSESVQLEIPNAYHLTHVYEGVLGLIEKFRSGKSERYQMFVQKLLPELIKKMSDGKRRVIHTKYRPCGI